MILIVIAPNDWRNKVYDGSLVMGNLMLASHALGLGSIWIHRAKEEFEQDYYKELLAKLGLEGEWEVMLNLFQHPLSPVMLNLFQHPLDTVMLNLFQHLSYRGDSGSGPE